MFRISLQTLCLIKGLSVTNGEQLAVKLYTDDVAEVQAQ